MGAYAELYAGLSEESKLPQDKGAWKVLWGKKDVM